MKATDMAYLLAALIARDGLLVPHLARYRSARVIPLKQGFAMIPLSEALMDEVGFHGPDSCEQSVPGFCLLPPAIAAWAEEISRDGAVAHLEIECFGGGCERGAIVWENEDVVLGPFPLALDPPRPHFYDMDLRQRDPIAWHVIDQTWLRELSTNQALRRIGVEAGERDEFGTVGLDAHRLIDEWVEGVS